MTAVSPGGAPDKHAAVRHMFGRIARRYDIMNVIMTGGLDRAWRQLAVREAAVAPGGLALDVGTGTGDVAVAMAGSAPGVRVVGLDYTAPMLRRAPAKAGASGVSDRTSWVLGDGLQLPFADGEFDAVTSAFVLRNFVDLGAALAEMARVAKPGGRVIALEIAPDAAPIWREAFALYFQHVVPLIGRLVAGDDEAYSYLPASVAGFLDTASVARLMRDAGLEPLPPRRMVLGSVAIHRGVKPHRCETPSGR
jgi:demethylmenaquinone methyltransferase/2-methoxy-6-polyprenyl-1,4-benzoquinol methylase